MIDLYEAGKLGPMNIAAFNSNAGAWRRYRIRRPDGVARALYMLRPTENVRVLQGGTAIAGTATTAPMLVKMAYYPIVIENSDDEYISIQSNSTTAGNLEVSIISDVASWTLTEV